MADAHVFTIPAGAPFLDTLVRSLLGGRLIPGLAAADPFALADVTLYLPTRRAARAIRQNFLDNLGRPLLLPRIRTLGDLDEDDAGDPEGEAPDLPPAVSAMERQLQLSRLVLRWSGALVRAAADLPDEELVVPASPADAARLAGSLGALLDQVGSEPAAWQGLFSGIAADHARYWEITLEFLRIVTSQWPRHLQETGRIDPGVRRDLLLRREATRLARDGSPAPVIAAGSTGSVPATAALLEAIARLPNGAVVLPGLDRHMDAESWDAVGPGEREPAGAGHPQHGLKKLLAAFGVAREDVVSLGHEPPALQMRSRFVSESMRPAATTDRWSSSPMLSPEETRTALADVGLVEAANEREEALAVAVLLRETAEREGRTAALVTPDRGLARRVAVELDRWGIDVDDSGGRPLPVTPPGILARLVAEAALLRGGPEIILALLQHPQASFGIGAAATHRAAHALERAVLRGPRLQPGLAALRHVVEARSRECAGAPASERPQRSEAARGLTPAAWAAAADIAARLEQAIAPLEALAAGGRPVALADLVAAHEAALMRVQERPEAAPAADDAGSMLASAFEELRASAAAGPDILPRDYPALFAVLIERGLVRRRGGTDPRIHIWGTLEARLQAVDRVVLGGLNEGTWPAQTRLDPLLSRPMRMVLELEPPERRIGLAAHDFAQAFGHAEVWLTRARRQDSEPRVASRWLQRLLALAGNERAGELRGRGRKVLLAARSLDRERRNDPPVRPAPSPPLALRPRELYATRIETLIRDPYAIHARFVLRLRAFEPLGKTPDAAERGSLIHDILETFVRERPGGPFDAAAEERLLEIGRAAFAGFAEFPEIGTLWWPRFEKIAGWFVREEAGRRDVVRRHVELTGRMPVTAGFTIAARADRIDRLQDGRLGIIDYKTGTPPSTDEVLSLAPQLPLEALIAESGGFGGVEAAGIGRLEYYQIHGRDEGGVVHARGTRDQPKAGKPAVTLQEALAATRRRLEELVAYFERPEAVYLSRKIPRHGRDFAGDYDHLARVAEWSVAEKADES